MSSSVSVLGKERREERRKVLWTLFLSLLFHIVFILLLAWLFDHRGENMLVPKKKEEAVTMDFSPSSMNFPPQYIETNPNQVAETPPQQTPFESDKNTRAASQLPAAGKLPLPTLTGRESQGIQFEDKEYSPGKQSGGAAAAASVAPPAEQDKQIPAPTPVPKTDLSILKPLVQTPAQKHISPPLSPAEQAGYQPETRVIRIDGNISNRGRAAMEVAATPLGRYKKLLSNAVGARWYYLVQRDMDLYRIGTVVIRFTIQQSGKVDAVQVISNTSNELLAATSIQSIKDAEMPPIPPEVAATLQEGRIEVDYTFSIISN